ncbi:MAG: nicotinate-nucleotide--dimethylbenzimidazole phosphoribosyltransferase [Acidobacteriota bacterium]|nr:MAG: nicotinate-nucleotide--dimethylbenzimidazole phosphoribosyltransferase [Acidobacteriota bacterium]
MVTIEPVDRNFAKRARDRQASLTKPPGSLGRLEELAVRLAAIQRTDHPRTRGRAIVIFAGDHGVTEEGVSPYPSAVTGQMLKNFASGGAAINAIAGVADADVIVVDVGTLEPGSSGDDAVEYRARSVRRGTRNMVREPAMTKSELDEALEVGMSEAKLLDNTVLVGLGEMGIGNTTAASAMTAALTGLPVTRVTGPGTGLDSAEVQHKVEVIERALGRALEIDATTEPLRLLQNVGGLEIAALVGFCLRAAAQRMAIVVDGFITTAAFAVAWRLHPEVRDYAFFAHRSAEPGHVALLEMMNVEPMLDLSLRLGEGTGAALAIPILDAAVAAHNEMATFESAGVSDKTP